VAPTHDGRGDAPSDCPVKVVLIGGIPESLVLFRGPLIAALVEAGHEVTAFAGRAEPWVEAELVRLGARFVTYPLDRAGTGLRSDISTYRGLKARLRETAPDVVIAYTAKPVIWGALAARRAGVPIFHAMITGRGEQFDAAGPLGLRATLLRALYRRALARTRSVVFQNEEDRAFFVAEGLVAEGRTALVAGSGVDLDFWREAPLPEGPPTFLMVARLLVAKGVREYAEAARLVRQDRPDVRFLLIGAAETGARGVPLAEVNAWHEAGAIEYLGTRPNVRDALVDSHVLVLPSYYGEGVPRTILEAMATGRPVLSTDNVGCRDAVVHGVTGRLVAPRDADALSGGVHRMLAESASWAAMGRAGRQRAEDVYDVKKVNARLLEITGLAAA